MSRGLVFGGLLLVLVGCSAREYAYPGATAREVRRLCPSVLQRKATSFVVVDGRVFPFHETRRGPVIPEVTTPLENALYACRSFLPQSVDCSPGKRVNPDGTPCEFQHPYATQ